MKHAHVHLKYYLTKEIPAGPQADSPLAVVRAGRQFWGRIISESMLGQKQKIEAYKISPVISFHDNFHNRFGIYKVNADNKLKLITNGYI